MPDSRLFPAVGNSREIPYPDLRPFLKGHNPTRYPRWGSNMIPSPLEETMLHVSRLCRDAQRLNAEVPRSYETPTPLGSPWVPWHRDAVGSYGGGELLWARNPCRCVPSFLCARALALGPYSGRAGVPRQQKRPTPLGPLQTPLGPH